MALLENLKELLKTSDFFNTYQLFRYDKDTEYRTPTGGFISIAIIVTIFVAFANMIVSTLNRTTIDYTSNNQHATDAVLTSTITSPESNFMFGVEVWGYNLSSDNRLFDVVFTQI